MAYHRKLPNGKSKGNNNSVKENKTNLDKIVLNNFRNIVDYISYSRMAFYLKSLRINLGSNRNRKEERLHHSKDNN